MSWTKRQIKNISSHPHQKTRTNWPKPWICLWNSFIVRVRDLFCYFTIEEKRRETSMTEADWSELPKDLLNLISQRFDNDLNLIRFRSVCSPWRRSSISNKHHQILPFMLPHFKISLPRSTFKYIIFLNKPPQEEEETPLRPWLIRITQNSRGKMQLFHPLLSGDSPTPYDFPYILDFNKFSNIVFLGTDFVIDWDKEQLTSSKRFHWLMLQHERRALRIKGSKS